jgi:hypothetical protein
VKKSEMSGKDIVGESARTARTSTAQSSLKNHDIKSDSSSLILKKN